MADNSNSGCKQTKHGEETTCGKCAKAVLDSHLALCCELCDYWYHIKCEGVPKAVYDFMVENPAGKQLTWHCSFCQRGMVKVNAKIEKIGVQVKEIGTKQQILEGTVGEMRECLTEDRDKCKQLEDRLGFVEARMVSLEDQLVPQVNGKVKAVEDNLAELKNKVKDEVTVQVQQVGSNYKDALMAEAKRVALSGNIGDNRQPKSEEIVDATTTRIQDRLNRLKKLVLYKAPEEWITGMNLNFREEKTKQDKLLFMKLCTEIGVDCKNEDISEIMRLGKYVPMSETNSNVKPRPILITLENGLKEKVLKNVHKLKNCTNEVVKNIGVAHDMNKEERIRDSLLKQEAKKKNQGASGSEFFHVVRGLPWEREVVRIRRRAPGTTVEETASGRDMTRRNEAQIAVTVEEQTKTNMDQAIVHRVEENA